MRVNYTVLFLYNGGEQNRNLEERENKGQETKVTAHYPTRTLVQKRREERRGEEAMIESDAKAVPYLFKKKVRNVKICTM